MIHFSKLIRHGQGLAPVLLKRATSITLDWDVRQKSRFESTDSAGRQVGIFLQRGQGLAASPDADADAGACQVHTHPAANGTCTDNGDPGPCHLVHMRHPLSMRST